MLGLDWPPHLRLFLALALSFLIGLERESSGILFKGRVFAGVRTYTLIGVFGFACAWLTQLGIEWALPLGILVIGSLALTGYLAKLREGFLGWTSEVAAVVTFVMGALCLLADIWVPTAIAIIVTFLLSEKAKLEKFVEQLDQTEFLAVVRFLIVTLIILPVLPDESYTQFRLNPRHIWQVVVLVSTIGFVGYLLAKRLGDRIGLWLSGLLGGIVSSTAVAVATGRIAKRLPERGVRALQASLIASTVMYVRILALVWFVNPDYVAYLWLKLVILTAIGLVFCLLTRAPDGTDSGQSVETLRNPFELRPALIFATLFVLLTVLTVLITRFYGHEGLIILAGAVGVTDIDPFILSLASNSNIQQLAVTAILVSMMSNTLAKGIYFGSLAPGLRRATLIRYGAWTLLHLPVILIK